jgi:excisionase family DNA binding protein
MEAVPMTAAELVQPTEKTAKQAQAALRVISLRRKGKAAKIELAFPGDKDEHVAFPPEAAQLLVRILSELANGNAVTVLPVNSELTTQQAADLLSVSRPYLVTLLEQGKIPHRKVGTRRRILCADVLAYKDKEAEEARAVLAELSNEAQKLNLGY